MLKILRRYNKLILVFGGCLLMILFLIPSVGRQGLGASLSSAVARYEGGKITQKDLMTAQRELEVLEIVRCDSIGLSMYRLLGLLLDPSALNGSRGIEGLEHWILLTEQARRAGLIGGPDDGTAVLDTLAGDLAQNFGLKPEDVAAQFRASRDAAIRSRGQLITDGALSKAHGVVRLLTAYRGFFPLSRPEALTIGRDIFDKVNTDLIMIPASAFIDQTKQPTPERINEFFESHRNKKAADDEFGIGYIQPPAVRFEFLTVDHEKIAAALTIDPVEVNKFWRQNKAQFGENFTEARATVEREYRSREASKLLQRARESVEGRIRLAASNLAKSSDQPPLTLKDVEKMLVAALPAAPAEQPFVTFFDAMEGWTAASQLGSAPGIGTSGLRLNERQSIPFSELILNMKELGGKPDAALEPIMANLKPTVPFGPLVDPMESLYYFRVLDARSEGPTQSVAEIQDVVVNDIRTLDAFELVKGKAEELRAQLAEKGAGTMMNEVKLGPRMTPDVEITRSSVRQKTGSQTFPDLDVPEFRDPIMDRVASWDPLKDIESIPAIDRTLALPSKSRKSLVLVQIKSRTPLTQEALKTGSAMITNFSRRELFKQYTDQPFSMTRLSERMKLKAVGRNAKSEAKKAEQAASEKPTESAPPAKSAG